MAGNDTAGKFERFDRNRIIFGAPGTGKSFGLNKDAKVFGRQEAMSNEELFREWLFSCPVTYKGTRLAEGSAKRYISELRKELDGIYLIEDIGEIEKICNDVRNNKSANKHNNLSSALGYYKEFIAEKHSDDSEKRENDFYVERVTFYPNYSYSQFVGCYKPVSSTCVDSIDCDLMDVLDVLYNSNLNSQDKYNELCKRDCFKTIGSGGLLATLVSACSYDKFLVKSEKKKQEKQEKQEDIGVYRGVGGKLRPYFSLLRKLIYEQKNEISYEFVPGPFIRVYEKAKRYPGKNFLLIIEEINRANAPAVFGDIFQSLDRLDKDENGREKGDSRYPVATSEGLRNYLRKRGVPNPGEIAIPHNMYIWATMNSADQGVQPLDTAFKRRWEFEYLDIDGRIADGSADNGENDEFKGLEGKSIPFDGKNGKNSTPWGKFRKELNDWLLDYCNVHEDKCLGPFFIDREIIENADSDEGGRARFVKTFKSKILMYLFEDVVKMNPSDLFKDDAGKTYSKICTSYDKIGLEIFRFSEKLLKEDANVENQANS